MSPVRWIGRRLLDILRFYTTAYESARDWWRFGPDLCDECGHPRWRGRHLHDLDRISAAGWPRMLSGDVACGRVPPGRHETLLRCGCAGHASDRRPVGEPVACPAHGLTAVAWVGPQYPTRPSPMVAERR